MDEALRPDPRELLAPAARDWLEDAARKATEQPGRAVPIAVPQLPRRLGRDPLPPRPAGAVDRNRVDFARWRLCDAGALWLLTEASGAPADDLLLDLFAHGDLEERTMVLRCLGCLPIGRVRRCRRCAADT